MPPSRPIPESSSDSRGKSSLVVTERDIVFNCPTCRGELVVDLDGAGMEFPCSHCGHPLIVPQPRTRASTQAQPIAFPAPLPAQMVAAVPPNTVPAPPIRVTGAAPESASSPPPKRTFDHSKLDAEQLARRLGELKHQLKENRSQDTEMRGHVNRATIELHRLQLRLKTLEDRHGDIQAELVALQARMGDGAA